MTSTTKVAIHGAAGRMGRRLIAIAVNDPDIELVAALENASHSLIGQDAGGLAGIGDINVPLTSSLDLDVNAVIDFSVPTASEKITHLCVEKRIPLVLATTGLDDVQQTNVAEAAKFIPIVWAPNMSLAVNLAMKLADVAAQGLRDYPSGVDVEIMEKHHRFKEDAPSGTALRFGEIIADVMGQTRHVHGREGRPGKRSRDEIGYHAFRVGDNPGEHTIVFGLLGESIEISVGSTNRDGYAQGSMTAARFVAKQSPGLYGMNDVFGL